MYRIKQRTYRRAKALGVEVKPSSVKGKKIDVYRGGRKVASVGALGYADYPTYLQMEKAGKVKPGTAEMKKKSYKARHLDRKKKGTPSYYADQLLWT